MNIKKWTNYALKKLNLIDNAKLDIEVLLSFILNKPRSWIICFDDYCLTKKQINNLNFCLKRRFLGEPLAYIINKKEFWSLSFFVSRKTLIPRPDSELLVEISLKKIKNNIWNILDLGTGCGNLAISIAYNKKNCFVTGIDYSEEIIKIAKYNSIKLNVKNIKFFCSNWFSKINKKKYNMIVSNPPYISNKEYYFLKKNLVFEPFTSLVSKKNGLFDIIYIIKNSRKYLKKNGWLFIEHSYNQKCIVYKLFKKYCYINIKTYCDYNNLYRITIGQFL
ncbi:MAG: peptide chain release factor N(5)-glutamine methyltransferase [Buchnera aphidicola (Periphyllus lyropictus)]|uniref:peptide chain release factor N(5)-glutamine methyltransferase n=1 Tax=Buchnera aphidicola TaxID=9 RepID=UPI001EBD2A1D|nr:peptide chain release factor N(5)-glutamine methyltransferase [Buchnera aphidicola]NIH16674.1 peptide chain release factor N(5)-glutamine methyltransferase [Buchnera aphidicola (Periphyllus lyropictus)]USS94581.1 peptide chain release factor N(5)-glutamine methyltransferase [Buchnera aphidicola (Periphyllus lyropictus)]